MNIPMITRRFSLVLAGLWTVCMAASVHAQTAPLPAVPRMVVLLVVDGLPMRQITGYQDQLAPDGFNRFLKNGTSFVEAHYGQGHTVTAAGHAVMLTGAYPDRTGIISNEWRNPQTGAGVYCTQDDAHTYIGHKTAPMSGTSPKNLLVPTLGDVLIQSSPRSKVIGISSKDRGAILPAGHQGKAYMYMAETGRFASSTYYMKEHPAWLEAFNAARPAEAYFKKTWTPLLPESAYARSVADGQKWQRIDGNPNRLPVVIGEGSDAPGPRFFGNLVATPFSDELTLDMARAAMVGEQLGQGPHTDILAVSLSGHDYVNHAFGPESRLSHDHLLHLDRTLQAFFATLDQRIGKDQYVAVLTADHAFADTPEWAQSQGVDAGRLNGGQLLSLVNTVLSETFGEARWTLGFSGPGILLDPAVIAAKGLSPAAVDNAAREALLQVTGIADVLTRAQLQAPEPDAPLLAAMRKSYHPQRSPSLYLVLKPGWIVGSGSAGTTHGSPHRYDTHVPILFYGPPWIGTGPVTQRVEVADIATTLAGIMRIATPGASVGKPLPVIARSSYR